MTLTDDLARYNAGVLRARAAYNATVDDCGTPQGVWRHGRDKTDLCDPCRDAKREYERTRYQARKEARRAA